jgi:hypothetical protein
MPRTRAYKEVLSMAKIKTGFGMLFVAGFGLFQLLPVDAAFAQQRQVRSEPMMMFQSGFSGPAEMSVKCWQFVDRTFGNGTGSEVHRQSAFLACIERETGPIVTQPTAMR